MDDPRPFAPYLLRSVVNAALNAIEKTAGWVQYSAKGPHRYTQF